ncbi:MAG: T9SS type A sorting domain-containing protein, partial [Bacteroidetes bacterium]|nr:T9SS type A sorting domain-containing protein [Bacteroidota bacterium]
TNTASIIFSNNGASQTANLSRTNEGWYKSGTWYSSQPAGKDELSTGSETPETIMLTQNYPNPFNPSTSIRFYMPATGDVKLTVYDVLGHEVRTLTNGTLSDGWHTFTFDATGLTSGVYFYRLESENFQSIKKMTLMK